MIGIGLGVAQLRRGGVADAPEYVEPVEDDPVAPPVTEPEPPTTTPTDPVTEEPEPGFDPDFTLPARIEIEDSGQTAVRTTNDPGTFGVAYIATPVSGDEYWEYDIQNSTPRGATFAIGITTLDMPLNGIPGERATEIAWWSDGTIRQGGVTLVNLGSGGAIGRGDLAGIAINGSGDVFLFKNCTALNAGASVGTLAPAGAIYPFVALYSARTRINMNFSTERFDCALPDGFFPIGQVPLPTLIALTSVESGTWVVPVGVTTLSEVLIVAGGGGGGSRNGPCGGGGGGGVIRLANVSVTPGGSISYTVGGGGAGGQTPYVAPTAGGDSVFGEFTAIGGGTGGSFAANTAGGDGGSGGGGGSLTSNIPTIGGSGTAGQGFSGSNGQGGGSAAQYAGGGGGAGGAGVTAATGFSGAGGAGAEYPTFSEYGVGGFFAGGGGGGGRPLNALAGAGGIGGGGAGGAGGGTNTSSDGRPGIANTGGGGGGCTSDGSPARAGGNGGSGVILIAY